MSELTRPHRIWRWRVFAATWLCYAGFYFCRKPFYIAKSALGESLDLDATALGAIGTAFLLAYTIGQFLAGVLGNRWGPRILLLCGMAVTIAVNVGFGLSNTLGQLVGLMALNGLAQGTGWSGCVGTMSNWFRKAERGTVMGFWATNFQAGGILANTLAAWALGSWGYRYSFFTGAAALLVLWFVVLFNQRNRPEDLGLDPVVDPDEEAAVEKQGGGWTRPAVVNVLLVGVFYFFVKFIRYAVWSWAPYFLDRNFGLAGDEAGYLSTVFDVCGVAGVIVTGVLSDRVFGGGRAAVSTLMIAGMGLACLAMATVGAASPLAFAISLGAVGFMLYGPDALMTGAGAMDLGSRRHATLAAGIINGMGSVGSVAQELVVGRLYDDSGGEVGPVLALLAVASVGALVMIGWVAWRSRRGLAAV